MRFHQNSSVSFHTVVFKRLLRVLFAFSSLFPFFAYAHPQACCENPGEMNTSHPLNLGSENPYLIEEPLQDFNPGVLNLVDQHENTYLLRGNLPQKEGVFCYEGLVNAIKACLLEKGIVLKENFKILDLSFLNYIYEHQKIDIEKTWFEENPQSGCFWLNSLYGSFINPSILPEVIRNFTLNHHDVDGLKSLMHHLKKIVHHSCDCDFVIYMHCAAGKDRTGEASAAYLMEYKGYSYNDAVTLDSQIAHRDLSYFSINAIRWYAYYLRDIKKLPWIGSID